MLAAPALVARFKFENSNGNILQYRNIASSHCKRVTKAGYTRVPMDTPGAYQLIDEETGDKFIVWGGAEDDDSSIPSKHVLSWSPNNNKPQTHTNQASNGGSAGNFGRLKFRRMRDLVRKSYTKNKERDVIDHDEQNVRDTSAQSSISSYSEPDQLKEQQTLSVPRGLAKVQQLESRNFFQKAIRMEDEGYRSDFDAKSARLVAPGSKASASSLRGWGGGGSNHYRPNGEEISRERRNFDDRNNFFSRKSFQDMGCSDYMIESLKNQHFVRPSHIQSMTFGPIIAGKSCIISDQSGSGKTLAYLLPLIQRLRQEELQGLSKPSSQSPSVVILAPTAELASQVLNTCRSFSKSGVPFRSMVVTGGFRQRTQLENLRQELDVLIATPGRFMFLIKEGYLQLTNLKCAVLDEVDILFNDEDFETAFQCLINSSPVTTQYLFVTATLPMDIYNKLVESFPDCELVTGPGMHRTSPGLEEVLVDCSGDETAEKSPDTAFLNKKNALLQLVESSPVPKTIVFCNKIDSCRKVENALKRFDRKGYSIKILPFHAALDQESRLANMKEFRSSKKENISLFLVCTDRASRGIDFEGVDHVVLFDYPRDPSEYVRRVGRTARGAGGKGKAFIFAVGKQVSLARRIMERNRYLLPGQSFSNEDKAKPGGSSYNIKFSKTSRLLPCLG
ncbi:DEAD-box ATP-dependent RNA helicase 50 isoform X1 [Lycium ferocissimum]|uniref:DEAD-box ATP-dependent RNA helicase 50 isoform X1 n=1 Tax=Lycium ferocissimum TaxID=112874 RepID=UPI0028166C35|nr:DEAD-box ATP-dependent RNA helicase 50 isoform X1 [Lycium ferocissimum]